MLDTAVRMDAGSGVVASTLEVDGAGGALCMRAAAGAGSVGRS